MANDGDKWHPAKFKFNYAFLRRSTWWKCVRGTKWRHFTYKPRGVEQCNIDHRSEATAAKHCAKLNRQRAEHDAAAE